MENASAICVTFIWHFRQEFSTINLLSNLEGTLKHKVKTIREASETRVMQVTEQSKSQISQLQAVITGQKSTRLEERNAELEARNSELSLKVQRLETRANAVQMESDAPLKAK